MVVAALPGLWRSRAAAVASPGAETVLKLAAAEGLPWSPLWCQTVPGVRGQLCSRLLPDSSQVNFQWGPDRRAHQFGHTWGRLYPVRAFDRRESPRVELERQGGRWVGARDLPRNPFPSDSAHRTYSRELKGCLDGPVVLIGHVSQRGRPWEFVHLYVAAVPDPDCSPEAARETRRITEQMQATGTRWRALLAARLFPIGPRARVVASSIPSTTSAAILRPSR